MDILYKRRTKQNINHHTITHHLLITYLLLLPPPVMIYIHPSSYTHTHTTQTHHSHSLTHISHITHLTENSFICKPREEGPCERSKRKLKND
jgi:hypothetical protein